MVSVPQLSTGISFIWNPFVFYLWWSGNLDDYILDPREPKSLQYAFAVIAVVICSLSIYTLLDAFLRLRKASVTESEITVLPEKKKAPEVEEYAPVEPLPTFTWQDEEPLQFRPLKPKYNLTMSIENLTVSELIVLDKNYHGRLKLRRSLMSSPDTRSHVLGAISDDPIAKPAVDELYTWLIGTYLPTRFPRIFHLTTTSSGEQAMFSTVTEEYLPVAPSTNVIETLERLGGTVEDEFLFLAPAPDGDGYRLVAFVTCFPAGFDTAQKLGLKLRDIHKPVPGYQKILAKSMDRFFDRLEVGRFVRRANWSIDTESVLCKARGGQHLYEGDEPPKQQPIDKDKTAMRCERQVLHRLPKTKAIVFSFKTYLYPIEALKEEGIGEQLAESIDGLKHGNVPGMHFYKKAVVWAESTKEYLRSQT